MTEFARPHKLSTAQAMGDFHEDMRKWRESRKRRFHPELGRRGFQLAKEFGIESVERDREGFYEPGVGGGDTVSTMITSKKREFKGLEDVGSARLRIAREVFVPFFGGTIVEGLSHILPKGIGRITCISVDFTNPDSEYRRTASINARQFSLAEPFGNAFMTYGPEQNSRAALDQFRHVFDQIAGASLVYGEQSSAN